jgi:hypothetical protein
VKNSEQPGLPAPLADSSNGTNVVKALAAPPQNGTPGMTDPVTEAADKKSPPAVDPALDETEHILQDYIKLLTPNRNLIAQ